MIKFKTNAVILCGPDCSGKTSLYNALHKKSGFKWNIHDRSFLSMLCYAKLYGRDEEDHKIGLVKEINNLNNRVIILLPPKQEILRRLEIRGDEFQSHSTLSSLYDIFECESKKLQNHKNVLLLTGSYDEEEILEKCFDWLSEFDHYDTKMIANVLKNSNLDEYIDLELNMSVKDTNMFSNVMENLKEKAYYGSIQSKTTCTILNEIDGLNDKKIKQDSSSRRFFYNSSDCISSIHFLIKESNSMNVIASLRSTDVERNSDIDIEFLCHLSGVVARQLNEQLNETIESIRMTIRFNCPHIRYDLENL